MFTISSQNPQHVVLLKALCLELNNMSPNAVRITRTSSGPQDLLIHTSLENGLWVSPYEAATDTVSHTAWEIPYAEITELHIY